MGLHQGVQKLWLGTHQQSWVVFWGSKPRAGGIEDPELGTHTWHCAREQWVCCTYAWTRDDAEQSVV